MNRHLAVLLATTALLTPAGASAVPYEHSVRDATSDELLSSILQSHAPNQLLRGYAPVAVECPKVHPKVRLGSTLSPQEEEWLPRRRQQIVPHVRSFLERVAIPGFDSNKYLANVDTDQTALPNIGLALSGGGYRAFMNAAGAMSAWDERSKGSTDKGNLGGLLQSAIYISGLSGGAWLISSLFTNNFTSVEDAANSQTIWQFQNSMLRGPEHFTLLEFYLEFFGDVEDKVLAGFNRSITDYWGRMLSYQLVNSDNGGRNFTFSSLAQDPDFANARTPLPIIVADGRAPNQTIVSVNATIFEFNPWEMGSSDPTLNGYIPLKYAGSRFNQGSVPDNETCVVGFDNVGYVLGTSSSLFNTLVLNISSVDDRRFFATKDLPDLAAKLFISVVSSLGGEDNDIADWRPNPFLGWNTGNNPSANSDRLALVDGGEDVQNIPLHPLLFEEREVDAIFAVDSSSDTAFGWPNGTSMVATYERALARIANGAGFPVIPDQNTVVNLGLNSRPSFFGCSSTNTTGTSPLVVYLPNYPYQFHSNISTFRLSFRENESAALIENGWAVVTQANSTRDPDWSVCVGCAVLARSFERTKTRVPDKCNQCFDRYCWNGTLDQSTPATYDPPFINVTAATKEDGSTGVRLASSAAIAVAFAAVAGAALAL